MISLLLLAGLLAQAPSGYTPAESAALFTEANDAYYRQDYGGAVEKYQRLLKAGQSGPDVLFNLGTTHLAAGNLGQAVLMLERAHRLSHDDDIAANLAQARQRQGDQVVGAEVESPFAQRMADALDERWITWGFLGAWYAAFLLWWMARRSVGAARLWLHLSWGAVGLGAVVLGAGVGVQAYVRRTVVEAVVQPGTAKVREFPGDNAKVSFEVHAGLKVRVMETSGRFARVRLPNALEGWTEQEGLENL